MAQFDVYRVRSVLLVDCQSDWVADLTTRLAIPLVKPTRAAMTHPRLNPTFDVDGRSLVLATQLAAAVPAISLGQPIASLADKHRAIVDALDYLIIGF